MYDKSSGNNKGRKISDQSHRLMMREEKKEETSAAQLKPSLKLDVSSQRVQNILQTEPKSALRSRTNKK